MNEKEILEIAVKYAQERGWPWLEPIEVRRRSRWFGRAVYMIRSKSEMRGRNVVMMIDAVDGAIKQAGFLRRYGEIGVSSFFQRFATEK